MTPRPQKTKPPKPDAIATISYSGGPLDREVLESDRHCLAVNWEHLFAHEPDHHYVLTRIEAHYDAAWVEVERAS